MASGAACKEGGPTSAAVIFIIHIARVSVQKLRYLLAFCPNTAILKPPCSSGGVIMRRSVSEQGRHLRRDSQSRPGRPRVTDWPYYEGSP